MAWCREAIVVNMDDKPFKELPIIIGQFADPRIRILDLGNRKYDHGMSAYDLTDEVITHCSSDASWLLATNGDNTYHPTFLSHLDDKADLVAFDWHTRYMHINDQDKRGAGCSRWRWGNCKVNIVRFWHTDLGANLINLKRWRKENRLFHVLHAEQDGRMIEQLVYDEWHVKHVHSCLFHHNPNPISCHEMGRVWKEDTHDCIAAEEGEKLILSEGYHAYHENELPFKCLEKMSV